jgi:adhesin transport system outer membrane protein
MRNNKFWPVLALVWLATAEVPYVHAQTLKEAVEQAVQTNPEVLVTTDRRLAADEGVKQAQGGYWPRVDLLSGAGRERLNDINARLLGLSDMTSTRRESSIVLSQMLFDGFGVKSEVARRRALVDSSAYDVAATAEDLALRVVGVYLDVLRRQETVAAAVDSLEVHQRIYDHIKLRSDSGVGQHADLDQAEGRLALAKVNLRSEQSNLKDATTTYLRLVGAAPRSLLKPPSLEQELPRSEGLALETALANNPTIKSAQADVAAADAQLAVAKAALWPRLDLEFAANHSSDIVQGRSNDTTVMLRVRYNLSHGGADSAGVRAARHQAHEANEVLNRTHRQIEESLSIALNAYVTTRDRLVSLRQYVESSDSTRAAYAKQFSIGQRTLLDLLNAENEYFNARLTFLSGQYTELTSVFGVFAGMGQLLAALQIALPAEGGAPSGGRQ